jgi:hypothetical protein
MNATPNTSVPIAMGILAFFCTMFSFQAVSMAASPGLYQTPAQTRQQVSTPLLASFTTTPVGKAVVYPPDDETLQIDLDRPAPPEGSLVRLSTDNPQAIDLPASVRVQAGQSRAVVTVKTRQVQTPQRGLIIAECGGVSKNVSIQINPGQTPAALTITPATVSPGEQVAYGIRIYSPQSTATTFRILADFGQSSTITVPAGQTSASVSQNAPAVPATRTVNYCVSPDSTEAAFPCRSAAAVRGTLVLRVLKAVASPQPITVSRSGGGSGTVLGSIGLLSSINCGQACSATLAPGSYEIFAQPELATSYFAGWGGDAASCGRNMSCTITVRNAPLNISARFERGTRLTVNVVGHIDGNGFISFSDSGVGCSGLPGSPCSVTYAPGDTVKLTINNSPNFLSWGGVRGCGAGSECNITIGNTAVVVTATFSYSVEVEHEGNGRGTVVSNPAGINCASGLCRGLSLTPSQSVTLTATPDRGSLIDSWSYLSANNTDRAAILACGSAAQCTFTPTGTVQVKILWKPAQ